MNSPASAIPVTSTGAIPVTTTGAIPVTTTGAIPVTSTGAIPVTSTGTIPVTSTGTIPIFTKDTYEVNLSKLNNHKINIKNVCTNSEINFLYHDITNKLCNKKLNRNANILEYAIKQKFPLFDIEKYFKFNPSIISLDNNYLLMSYRIYLGNVNCNNFTINTCHPWIGFWQRDNILNTVQDLKYNYVGLSIINKNTFEVVKDVLLDIIDYPLGLEDVRLLEYNNNIYLNGALTLGITDSVSTYGDPRILRQVLCLIGTKNDILLNLSDKIKNININCIELHATNMEKNWFGYDDIILNPKYGEFFPIKKFKLDLSSTNLDVNNTKYFEHFKNIKTYKCNNLDSINENNLIKELNNKYNNFLFDEKNKLFRISGGSWGINYDSDTILFIGHIVVYIDKLNFNSVEYQLKSNPDSQISKNLYQFIKQRQNELQFKDKKMRYFQVFFKYSKSLNQITSISNSFNIFEEKNLDTSINFPMGLIKDNDNYIISFGESDYKTILVKMDNNSLNKLFEHDNLNNYKFLTYIKDKNITCI